MFRGIGLVMYKLYYTNRAKKDAQLIKASNLKSKVEGLLNLIAQDPYGLSARV
jgi:Txe/YoeB family toxin of Txe-Axe toxin-antitoxin module